VATGAAAVSTAVTAVSTAAATGAEPVSAAPVEPKF
jgi:hypothetical protein